MYWLIWGRLHFGEAVFVFTIMTILSARPILWLAEILIVGLVRVLPGSKNIWFYARALPDAGTGARQLYH